MFFLFVLALLQNQSPNDGQHLLGAAEVIRRLAEPSKGPDFNVEFAAIKSKSEDLRLKLDTLPPVEAAKQWVALAKDWFVLADAAKLGSPNGGPQDNWGDIMMPSLPPPEVWPPIRESFAKMPQTDRVQKAVALFDRMIGPEPVSEGAPDTQEGANTHKPYQQANEEETQEAERRDYLANLDKMDAPRWSLVRGLEDFDFVAALVKKFGEQSLAQSDHGAALAYALGLAKRGDRSHAVQILETYGNDPCSSPYVKDRQQAQEAFDLFAQMLGRSSREEAWETYLALAESLGRQQDAFNLVDDLLKKPGLSTQGRLMMLDRRAGLEAVLHNPSTMVADYEVADRLQPGFGQYWLLSYAKATKDHGLLDFVAKESESAGTSGAKLDLFDAYVKQDRLEEAQAAAIAAPQNANNVNTQAEGQGRLLDAYPSPAIQLAEIYYRLNQPEQIVTLLNEYPKWGAADLVDIVGYRYNEISQNWSDHPKLGFYVAWAFDQTGKRDLAVKVLHDFIFYDLNNDEAFELLNKIEGAGALPFYERLIGAYPYRARPLMWKADLMLKLGKPEEARRLAQSAISLDPADEGAEPGRRQQAYEILGRILKSQGESDEAAKCGQIVAGARLDEEAESDEDAELYDQALSLFDQAIKDNPADYRAREHTAEILQRLGDHDEALKVHLDALAVQHLNEGPVAEVPYERYSEDWQTDQEAVDSFLKSLLQEWPNDPAVLVELAKRRVRNKDQLGALALYEKAAKIDPAYVRAWKGIQAEGNESRDAEEATMTLLRIDPMDSNATGSVAVPLDNFAALYKAYKRAYDKILPVPQDSLYPLPASKASMEGGTRNAESMPISTLHYGPGACLATLTELQVRFP